MNTNNSAVVFDNANVARSSVWMRDNDSALRSAYVARGRRLPQHTDNNLLGLACAQGFLNFCIDQHGRASSLVAAA